MPLVWKHFRTHLHPEILPGILRTDAVRVIVPLLFRECPLSGSISGRICIRKSFPAFSEQMLSGLSFRFCSGNAICPEAFPGILRTDAV
jgi:hypothetical protein